MNQSTQWRREDTTRARLEREGFEVIRIGCGSESTFHLVASSTETVRFIHVLTQDQAPMREIGDFPVPIIATREVWKWKPKLRKPEIVVV